MHCLSASKSMCIGKADKRVEFQPLQTLPREILGKIFNYLLVIDQANLSLTCKYIKKITDHTFCVRAWEYGCLSPTLPKTREAKRHLSHLFNFIRDPIIRSHVETVSFQEKRIFLCFSRTINKFDCERTLLNTNVTPLRIRNYLSLKPDLNFQWIKCFGRFVLRKYSDSNLKLLINDKSGMALKNRLVHSMLIEAIRAHVFSDVKRLINLGADVNIRYESERTPLAHASYYGAAEIVALLLDHGADPNIDDFEGNRPIHLAVRRKHVEIVKQLLVVCPDVNILNKMGYTPLNQASYYGTTEIVALLLDHDADPSIAERNGNQPLHFAAQRGHDEVVRLLLMKGAKINASGLRGDTALSIAI